MKINYFKIGAIAYILLGIMHLLAHLLGSSDSNPLMTLTFTAMKNATIQLLGEHTIWQFYNGFSITMGVLLCGFGLQAYTIESPSRRTIAVNIFITLIVFILSIIYFHLIASTFNLMALLCFGIAFINHKSATQNS